jgi:hypothetical protein
MSTFVAPAPAPSRTLLHPARVRSCSGRELVLEQAREPVPAALAFSCPAQPRPGDLVLCLDAGAEGRFVLAILERPGSQAMTLAFPGEILLQTEGSLSLLAGQSITLAAGERLTSACAVAVHQSRETVLGCGELLLQGRVFQASFDAFTFTGRMFQTLVRHLVQKTFSYFRQTEAGDQVRAGQILRQAEGLYSVTSQYSVLVSAKDTRIDGERIHMG